ncbi:MAG: hypothetical protein ACXVBV_20850 [Isosphaeraceae bacterium]
MEFLRREEQGPSSALQRHSPKRGALLAMFTVLGLITGCSFHRAADRSGESVTPPHAPPQRRDQLPTIGTDTRTVPPGQTIPAAGLGVDLL